MNNPFINYWLWYYDKLWQYWPAVVVLTVIAVWLAARRYMKRQQEWDAYMEKSRKEDEDFRREIYENKIINIDIHKIKPINRLEYDCSNFHVVIENGELTFTDKETGEVFHRKDADVK